MKIYQIWYETDVGPCFSTKQKAIDHINNERARDGDDPWDPNDPYGYPDIREFEVDTGHIRSGGSRREIDFYDR